MITVKTIEVSEAAYVALTDVVEKLSRRAVRHGVSSFVLTVEHTWTEDERVMRRVKIEGHAPRINGWALAARIENNETIGTVVRPVPGVDEDLSEYRNHDFRCDHCNTRRRRNDVFVLINESGERKVVGRNCLADFVRTGDAESLARYAEILDELGIIECGDLEDKAYGEGFGRATPTCDLERYLPVVAMLTRRLGWTSRSAVRENPELISTANNASRYIWGRQDEYWRRWVQNNDLYVSDKDRERADAAIEWAKSIGPGQSEYLYTICTIAQVGTVDANIDGYAASIIQSYNKYCERERERAQVVDQKEFIGSEGERLRGQRVTVKGIHPFEGSYGLVTIVRMEAKLSDGVVAPIVWFASGEHDYDIDAEYDMTATVKSHDEHDCYGKQTKVNRAKLEKV